jgi:cleavage stimulation factor subunit 3
MATIRRVYQRAIATPTDGLEQMWKSYQAWEMQIDPKLATELTQKFAIVYTNARIAQRERSTYLKGF